MYFHKNFNEHRVLEVIWLDCELGDHLCVVYTYCPVSVRNFFIGNILAGAWCWFTIHGCISTLPYNFV